jgi:hypothetical protein
MPKNAKIISSTGEELSALPTVPKIKAVHPCGSKIMIEDLRPEEVLQTQIHVPDKMKLQDAPQAYIVELGPKIPEDSGYYVGQRIYWQGTGVPVKDPRQDRRVRALIELHQVIAIIEEEKS